MDYRRLGKSGLRVSEFSFGSWVTFAKQVGEDDAASLMSTAYDAGINFFDNAEVYEQGKSEMVMGEALSKLGWDRDTYMVSSKVFWGGSKPSQRGLSAKHVTDACHMAMKRLQVDYLDLYYCHRPDTETPIEETVRAMHNLIVQGKVIYWGTSEWSAQQLTEAHLVARQNGLTPPTMEQPEYNMFNRQKVEVDYLPIYELGLGTTIWSPLASGVLTGKYNDGIPQGSRLSLPGYEWLRALMEAPDGQERIKKARQLSALAKDIGISLTHMALLWCNANPRVSTTILGASNKSQLVDNLKALDHKAKMTAEVMEKIEDILGNKPEKPPAFALQ